MTTRAERLHQRFKLIQRTLTELHGGDRAFAAASAAWLMALQYVHKIALEKVAGNVEDDSSALINTLEKEMETLLQSFHEELCEHLGADQAEAWRLARAFKEVIRDICHQGG